MEVIIIMKKSFMEVLKDRRSIYGINNNAPISDEKTAEMIKEAVKHVPSAFNSQSARVVVLFGDNHLKLWEIVMDTLRKIVPADKFAPTENKINSFAKGHGTVLYFDDTAVTEDLMKKFPLYAENFPVWAEQSNGMVQFAVWALLEEQGFGATLQHYNPLIDNKVKEEFNLPAEWKLIAQMPFGTPTEPAGNKDFVNTEERVKIFY